MPKGMLAALIATADPDKHHYYFVHAAEDCLCDWKPTDTEFDMLQQSLHITYVKDRGHCPREAQDRSGRE